MAKLSVKVTDVFNMVMFDKYRRIKSTMPGRLGDYTHIAYVGGWISDTIRIPPFRAHLKSVVFDVFQLPAPYGCSYKASSYAITAGVAFRLDKDGGVMELCLHPSESRLQSTRIRQSGIRTSCSILHEGRCGSAEPVPCPIHFHECEV